MVKTLEQRQIEAVQLSGQLEDSYFIGRWRFDGSPSWFEFEFQKDNNQLFKGHFQLKNKNGLTTKIAETLTLEGTTEADIVGTGSNVFGEFTVWGKKDEKTNTFEGYKKYITFNQDKKNQQEQQKKKKKKKKKSLLLTSTTTKKNKKKTTSSSTTTRKRSNSGRYKPKGSDDDDDDDDIDELEQEDGGREDNDDDDDNNDDVDLIEDDFNSNDADDVLRLFDEETLDDFIIENDDIVSSEDIIQNKEDFSQEEKILSSGQNLLPLSSDNSEVTSSSSHENNGNSSSSNKYTYYVRLTGENQKYSSTKQGRARRKIRDFVLSLQSRHFFPYDQNDYSLGPPESHPMKPFIELVKVIPSSKKTGGQNHNTKKRVRQSSFSSVHSMVSTGSQVVLPFPSIPSISYVEKDSPVCLDLFRYPGTTRHYVNKGITSQQSQQQNTNQYEYVQAKFETDGSCYEGQVFNGLRHGNGVAGYWNGHLYLGSFKKGLEHGEGELRDASGSLIYRGEFESGRISGKGTFYYQDGSVYRGELRESARHGKGIIWYQDGSVYEGDFVHGVRAGQGVYIGVDTSQYSGEWSHDVRHGKGVLKLADGTTLDGLFKDNHPDGRCILHFTDGSLYEGNFKEGYKDGRGTYTFGNNNAVYEGRFARDQIGGIGTLKLCQESPIELPHLTDSRLSEWMMPIELQSEIKFVHLKAGFSEFGT